MRNDLSSLWLLLCICLLSSFSNLVFGQIYELTGELKKWHKVTITFDGPNSSETDSINPFTDYRLDVTFTNGAKQYIVPGYFGADGNSAETSATAGTKWVVHFAPDTIGTWQFDVSFLTGVDVAISNIGAPVPILDTIVGSFNIDPSDKLGKDLRTTGRLEYVNENYLRYKESNKFFFKVGADAPENTLAYEDFDDVPNHGNRRKSWSPHQQDYAIAEAQQYTWKNGKGSELLGAVRYLSDIVHVNAFSFLTFNVGGDDDNVFPHLLKVDINTYNGLNNQEQWSEGVYKDRFDISRLSQWERIFEYADSKGMYLHFKLQETENDHFMDGGETNKERKLYFRTLISRFGHHLAMNWNLGEENTQTTQQRKDMAQYFFENDPYQHLIVLHTFPNQQNGYNNLDGLSSKIRGASIQTANLDDVHTFVRDRVTSSNLAGVPWVVACDEPGNANIGIDNDPNAIFEVRNNVIWGILMAGGAGMEYYYGYQTNCSDLNCEDHRTRETKYLQGSYAINFFQTYLEPHAQDLENMNEITSDNNDYVIGKPGEIYAVYQPSGKTDSIELPTGLWTLIWFNPRSGTTLNGVDTTSGIFSAPDTSDWVALFVNDPNFCPPVGTFCDDGNPMTEIDTINLNCECEGIPCLQAGTPCDDGNDFTLNDIENGFCDCFGTFEGDTDIFIEAEEAEYGSQWTLTADIQACGEYFLLPPNDVSTGSAPNTVMDWITFSFNISFPGLYKVFGRIFSTEDGDDSFWVRANNGPWQKWNKINFPYTNTNYQWSQVGNWTGGDYATPVTFNLSSGPNTIDFSWREPNARIDKIFITMGDKASIHQVNNNNDVGFGSLKTMATESCPNDTLFVLNQIIGDTIHLINDVEVPYNLYIQKGNN